MDPDEMEFNDTMENGRKKLELPPESAMPCKIHNSRHGEIRCTNNSDTRRSKIRL